MTRHIAAPLFVFLAAGAVHAAAADESINSTAPTSIPALIADLESPDCTVRDAATIALAEMGPECYDPLREAFQMTRFYEVRRRIRQIALEIYLTERFGPPRAFLGISHRGMPVVETQDPRVPAWATALSITDVFKASSAQKAGLQSGDLVTALNGRAATLEYQALEFTRWISEQTPGTRCQLTVLRGGRGVKLAASPRAAFKPQTLEPASYEVRTHDQDQRVPPGVAGILLTDIKGVPLEIDVRDGDLILALDEESIPLENAADRFERWRQGAWQGKGVTIADVRQLQLRGGRIAPAGEQILVRSAQILRGGEGLNIAVSLGRWPTYLPDQILGAAPRAGGGAPRDQVIESFGSWWQETFDPDLIFTERAEYDPQWQLKPSWKAP